MTSIVTRADMTSRLHIGCRAILLLTLLMVSGSLLAAGRDGVRIAVISDLNSSYGTIGHHRQVAAAVEQIIDLRPDLVISTGDMIAGQRRDLLPAARLEAMWDALHDAVTKPLARAGIPLAVTPGNHDASRYAAFARERSLYARVWSDRTTGLEFVDKARFPFTYAFAVGGTLLISLDVTTAGSLDVDDRAWLEDLLKRTRDHYSRRIVFSHLPVWPVAEGRLEDATRDLQLHTLLADTGVDLYLSGHHHAFYPGTLDGITYVSQACLGSGPRQLIGSTTGRAPHAFTLIDVDDHGLQIAALAAPDFREPIDWALLPDEITTDVVTLRRADLVDVPVSPLLVVPAARLTGNRPTND